MEYINSHIILDKLSAVTLGNFDGIHLGHRKLINMVKEYAKKENILSIVCSFLPHPKILFKEENFSLILTPEEKKERIKKMDVDMYIDFPFTKEFSNISPEQFVEEFLIKNLKCKVIIVGQNYKFGIDKKGTPKLLEQLGKKHNVEVITIPSVVVDNEVVSSTHIRDLLLNMELKKANSLLYEPYSIIGKVVEGKKLGRVLGFPTINILAEPIKLFPVNGVYATRTIHNNITYNSITNIGYNPTVSSKTKIIETNILDFSQFVYGEKVEVQFLEFFRHEIKFNSIEELKKQIESDTKRAKDYFKNMYQ